MGHRGLRKQLVERVSVDGHKMPDLPPNFVEWEQQRGRQPKDLKELARDFQEWQRFEQNHDGEATT